MMEIPYATTVRPDTGFTNGKLGMWLFVASEVMFFGGLFSAYAFLRLAAADWPPVALPWGAVHAGVMLGSLVAALACVYGAARATVSRVAAVVRLLLFVSMGFGGVFLAFVWWQYRALAAQELFPRTNTYVALVYLLTGVHALHVVGAMVVQAWYVVTARWQVAADTVRFEGRVELLAMFWALLVVLWLVKFVVFYVV